MKLQSRCRVFKWLQASIASYGFRVSMMTVIMPNTERCKKYSRFLCYAGIYFDKYVIQNNKSKNSNNFLPFWFMDTRQDSLEVGLVKLTALTKRLVTKSKA